MKKLSLIFHGRFPSDKAAALFAAKSAEAFAVQGLDVTVLVPCRKGIITKDPFDFFSVKKNFKIKYLPIIDIFSFKKINLIAFWISFFSFSFYSFLYIRKNSSKEDVVYSNETFPLFLASFIRPNCFYEMHDFPESKLLFFGKFLSRMKWVLIHNKWKLSEVKKLFPKINNFRFIYEPNAVDIKAFDIGISKEEARNRLGLPLDKKIVVYTGHLYGWKGVATLAETSQFLDNDFLIVFVGGTSVDMDKFKIKYGHDSKINIVGHKMHSEIPLWQRSADVLVLPNTAKEKISAYYTSPMKLFEYMASKKPIVASDIPSIKEIVSEENVFFVLPDDSAKLALGIKSVFLDDALAEKRAIKSFEDVRSHTWQNRAERIINFMNLK
jgi:glycosyltransferase involved in cell wall biosynthesis